MTARRLVCLALLCFLPGWFLSSLADEAIPHAYPSDAVYQYSVPVPDSTEMRAYLWIPPQCKQVRGVLLGIQNMLEVDILGDPEIRQACTDCHLGIVFITPGDDPKDSDVLKVHSPYHTFKPKEYVADHILQVLKKLAVESGYPEIENAPMIPTAHSAATPFGWGLVNALPERMIAFFPCKGWYLGLPPGVPTLYMSSEYAEVGGVNWGETWKKDQGQVLKIRGGAGEERLIGECVDLGAGHYEWTPEVGPMVGMFIRKAVAARLPSGVPANGPVQLKPITPSSGCLLDPATMGTPTARPMTYGEWSGDPRKGFWYFDAEMAKTVNDYMVQALAKKPQVIDFIDGKGEPASLEKGGEAGLGMKWLDDGINFQVAATFLDKSPIANLYGSAEVGHSTSGSILYKAGSGCLKQTGPDTFRIWMRRGGYIQQGSPWDPHIIAYHPGDGEYRRADRPGHPWLSLVSPDGSPLNPKDPPQSIDFPKIDDQVLGVDSIHLQATTSANLPVQFWVLSGPVELMDDNTTLKFLPIPPNSRFPVRVIIGAYQGGKHGTKVQSAPPVTREFFIKKSASDPTGIPDATAATTEAIPPK